MERSACRSIAGHGFQRRATVIRQLRQPKIEDLGLPAGSQKNVGRFQVAMHDALVVGDIERIGNLDSDVEDLIQRKRMAVDLLGEAFAFEQLHGDEVLPIALLDGVDGADVGMVQPGGGARLLLEPLQSVCVPLEVAGQEFQRHVAAQPAVLGFVHYSHAAGAQLLQHGVVQDAFPDQAFQALDSSVFDSIAPPELPSRRALALGVVKPDCV